MSHSSTPYDMLGDGFKLLSTSCDTFMTLPTPRKQASLLSDPALQESVQQHRGRKSTIAAGEALLERLSNLD